MFEIKKINLSSLLSFVNSAEYDRLKHKPISPSRAISYVNNPRASGTENVLYLIYDDNDVIAYRSVLVDQIYINNQALKVAWFSGSWVAANRRREGLSTLIQDEILKDWDDQLLFANYAPDSKKLYDKTGSYNIIKTHEGIRYYRRLCLKELLTPKSNFFKRISGLLGITDTIFNVIADIRFAKDKPFEDNNCVVEEIDELGDDHVQFLEKNKESELFRRGVKEFHWINNYPWVGTDEKSKEIQEGYHFSTYSESFQSRFYCLRDRSDAKVLGMVMININQGRLTIPYIYITDGHYNPLSQFILNLCNRHKVKYVTCYDSKLISELNEKKFYFLFKKQFGSSVFAHRNLGHLHQDFSNFHIQMGDGDAVFT